MKEYSHCFLPVSNGQPIEIDLSTLLDWGITENSSGKVQLTLKFEDRESWRAEYDSIKNLNDDLYLVFCVMESRQLVHKI